MESAQAALEQCKPQEALEHIYTALSETPNDPELLELAGTAYMDLMNAALTDEYENLNVKELVEKAISFFMASVSLNPESGYSKYLYLGQLTAEMESIKFYEKGLEILENDLKKSSDKQSIAIIKRKMAQTCCSIVELYMTDCCHEPQAQTECLKYVQLGHSLDPNSEVYQTMASLQLTLQQFNEATESIKKAVKLWISMDPSDVEFPNFQIRFAQAKLLVECALYETALDVLETVLKEDDQDPQVWYVLGWCYFLKADGTEELQIPESMDVEQFKSFQDAFECLENAVGCHPDEDIMQHSQQLLVFLENAIRVGVEQGLDKQDDEMDQEQVDQ